MEMVNELKNVLRMKEGTDETSYAKSSYIQKQVLSLTKPMKEKAIRELYCKKRPTTTRTIHIADLGCSSSKQNTLCLVTELIHSIQKARRELGKNDQLQQEYQVYLNDLPWNDFNTIFRSLTSFEDDLKHQIGDDHFGRCFVNGVPGSFYGRLFPTNSLHLVHSSYSLHWLSQVPKGIESNKTNIYIARTSPPNVLKSYSDQFEKDFTTFLRCRSKEVVDGGIMVLTMLGRKTNQLYSKDSCYFWDLLTTALNDMVFEGFIEENNLNTFNIPMYSPSARELDYIVKKEGSFVITEVQLSEVSWEATENDENSLKEFDNNSTYDFANCMRSVAEPLLLSHFGESVIEELFKRYKDIIQVSMAKEKNVFINITASLTKG